MRMVSSQGVSWINMQRKCQKSGRANIYFGGTGFSGENGYLTHLQRFPHALSPAGPRRDREGRTIPSVKNGDS
jgi:hypothetical protein